MSPSHHIKNASIILYKTKTCTQLSDNKMQKKLVEGLGIILSHKPKMVDSVSMYSGLVTCEAVGKRLGKLLLFDRLLYWPHTAWEHWRTKPSLHYILTESTISSLWHSNDPTCTCTSSTCTNFSQQLQDEAKKQVSHSCIDWSSSHASQSSTV